MGYFFPLGGSTRHIPDTTITLHSCKFTRGNTVHFGGRAAVINIPGTNKIVVWNPLPESEEFENLLNSSVDGEFEVIANIVPDKEHTMATAVFKKKYPNSVSIGPQLDAGSSTPIDYTFKEEMANKIFTIEDESVPKEVRDNFEFMFLTGHLNHELVVFDKSNKTLFEADLLFNIPSNGVSEQYPDGGQTSGKSFAARWMNPESRIGRFLHRKVFPPTPSNKDALKQILSWDFERIVMSHGDVIETDAKSAVQKMFSRHL